MADKPDIESLRARFLKAYSSVPVNYRDEVIALVRIDGKDQPVSWAAAYVEVLNNTAKGEEILKKMDELKLLEGA